MLRWFVFLIATKLCFVVFVNSESLSYIPDALIFVSIVVAFSMRFLGAKEVHKNTFFIVLGCLGLYSVAWFSAALNAKGYVATFTTLLRTISPLLLLALLLQTGSEGKRRITLKECRAIIQLLLFILGLILYGVILLPGDANRGEQWWGTAIGGLHESSYTLLGTAILAYAITRIRPTFKHQVLCVSIFAFTLIALVFGWGVRTAALVFLLFIVVQTLGRFGLRPIGAFFIISSIGFVAILALFALNTISIENITMLTSGRTAMYLEKLEFLSANTSLEWAFGHGYGSDLMHSDVWWWAPKGAHNDYLTFLTEYGIAFLFLLILVLFCLFHEIGDRVGKVIFFLALMTSLISNGYIVRPAAAYVLVIAIALLSKYNGENAAKNLSLEKSKYYA